MAIALAALLAAVPASAQWLNHPTAGIPRMEDGKPNLSAPAPKLVDGTPDLSGIWLVPGLKYLINVAADLKEVPFQPWPLEEYNKRMDSRGKEDPNNFCLPSGIPEKDAVTSPWKIVQTPGLTMFLYESRTIFRQVFTDLPQAAGRSQSKLAGLFDRPLGRRHAWLSKRPVRTARPGLIRTATP